MKRGLIIHLLVGLFCILSSTAYAEDINSELNQAQEKRYIALIAELRCLVCQNQNIADSNAPLAQDLREQVRNMILSGKSDTEIKAYLVERYGDFVLYRPPVKPSTWLLWGSPFLLLLLGLIIAWRISIRRRPESAQTNQPDREALQRALKEDEPS
ncbi:MAG: cytochrome c-type biogenesis protein [Salinisphaeraceae bacterium]|nr:cytochrome c-type biogenesis protein [Salinisphaeraceae bacterium]